VALEIPEMYNSTGSSNSECRDYHLIHNSSLWCDFINNTEDCSMNEGFVNYINVMFCSFPPSQIPLISVLYGIWLIFLFCGLATTAEKFFCPALQYISSNLKLSENIAGLTIVAFGNGSPDIFSAVAAFTNSNPNVAGVAVGSLIGSAILLSTIVAGLVSFTQSFSVAKRPFLRDLIFYIAAVYWLFCLLYRGNIDIYNSVGFLVFYVVYVLIAVIGRYINQRSKSTSIEADERSPLLSHENNVNDDFPSVNLNANNSKNLFDSVQLHNDDKGGCDDSANADYEEQSGVSDLFRPQNITSWHLLVKGLSPFSYDYWKESGFFTKIIATIRAPWMIICKILITALDDKKALKGWNRPLFCINILTSPLFALFAVKKFNMMISDVMPLWVLVIVISVILAFTVWVSSTNHEKPVYCNVFAYTGFVSAIILVYTIATEIVNLIQTYGVILNLSNTVMGVTLLAWGNAIPDVFADVALARQGFPRMSFAASFGGPLFSILCKILY